LKKRIILGLSGFALFCLGFFTCHYLNVGYTNASWFIEYVGWGALRAQMLTRIRKNEIQGVMDYEESMLDGDIRMFLFFNEKRKDYFTLTSNKKIADMLIIIQKYRSSYPRNSDILRIENKLNKLVSELKMKSQSDL